MPVLRTITLGFLLAVLSQTAWAKHADTAHKQHPSRPVLLELFTSQGCSDCPAADRMVTELANRNDVIALSLPITYWDILGWKDTFATDANTRRQKSYAQVMNRSGIYTPQMIIDGRLDVVGNQRDRVMQAVEMRSGAISPRDLYPDPFAQGYKSNRNCDYGERQRQQGRRYDLGDAHSCAGISECG